MDLYRLADDIGMACHTFEGLLNPEIERLETWIVFLQTPSCHQDSNRSEADITDPGRDLISWQIRNSQIDQHRVEHARSR